jgi:hypothetical protein
MDQVEAFRFQARACQELGSSMYAALLDRMADDLADGGAVVGAVLTGHEDDPGPSALALRLVGGIHRQVLSGVAPELAGYYPSVGGVWDLDDAWPRVAALVRDRHDVLVRLLEYPPQTNEVGRSCALVGGLLHVAHRTGRPIRLFEIGASGGLNLRADQFRYLRADRSGWGPRDSPVVLDPAWRGAVPPDADVRIVERVGSDIEPVDVGSEAGRLTLLSYVWPDQLPRLTRLRGAFEVARRIPADLRRCDAVSMLRRIDVAPGTATVVWHSVMWQYLTAEDKAAASDRIEEIGAAASADKPFAHVSLEPQRRTPDRDREFLVTLRLWPGGRREVLGSAAPHGVPTTWEG